MAEERDLLFIWNLHLCDVNTVKKMTVINDLNFRGENGNVNWIMRWSIR